MIVAVAGWRGVGSTTAALLLASAFAAQSTADEDAAWLVEADSAGGVLAGRMQLPAAALGGLEQLCFPPAGVGVEPAAVAARRARAAWRAVLDAQHAALEAAAGNGAWAR